MQLLQSIKHIYEMMFYNKTMELHIHALMHAHVNKQLIGKKKVVFVLSFNQNLVSINSVSRTGNTAVYMMELTIQEPAGQLHP